MNSLSIFPSKNGFRSFDINKGVATGYKSYPITANKVIINTNVPKHWAIQLNAESMEVDSVVHLLSNTDVLTGVVGAMKSYEFVSKFFELATTSKSGVFASGSAILSYDLILMRVKEALKYANVPSSDNSVVVVAALMIDVINQLDLVAYSGATVNLLTKINLFSTYDDIVNELRRYRLKAAVQGIDRTRIKTSKQMGVQVVADQVFTSFAKTAVTLERLEDVERDLQAVFSLIKTYTIGDYKDYKDGDIDIFSDAQFLELASNFSLVMMTFEKAGKLPARPAIGPHYWPQVLARVNDALRSSNTIQIVDINSVKEYFTYSAIKDSRGIKRGVVISKNLADKTPFEPYIVTIDKNPMYRVRKDVTASNALSPLVEQYKRIDSSKLHEFSVNMFQLLASRDAEMFTYGSFLDSTDMTYLAAAFAPGVEIGHKEEGAGAIKADIYRPIFRVHTLDSKVLETVSLLGMAKYEDPAAVLFFMPEDGFAGKAVVAFESPVLDKREDVNYVGLKAISTENLGNPVMITNLFGGKSLKMEWKLDNLLNLPGCEKTKSIKPVIGSIILDEMTAIYKMLAKASEAHFKAPKEFKLSLSIAFLKLIEPVFLSSEIANIAHSVTNAIWFKLREMDEAAEAEKDPNVRKEAKDEVEYVRGFLDSEFNSSSFYKHLRLKLSLFIAYKLNYITDGKILKEIEKGYLDAGVYNVI